MIEARLIEANYQIPNRATAIGPFCSIAKLKMIVNFGEGGGGNPTVREVLLSILRRFSETRHPPSRSGFCHYSERRSKMELTT